jgi:repressor of nif and glnA expression
MEFLTVHELSRQFNISARSVRYRLQRLIDNRKFKNGEDYRREDLSDAQHFTWKINPISFMREYGLRRSAPPSPPSSGG